jgi:hypothetical protein
LRGMRQRAFVVLGPNQIPRIDPAVACLASEIILSLPDATPVVAFNHHKRIKLRAVHGIQSACGEFDRTLLNARPIGAAGVLWCAGDDFAIHDGVELAVNHRGVRDGQHHIAMPNVSATHHHCTGERG